MSLTLQKLRDAVRSHIAIKAITRLQPIGGAGDKVFPQLRPIRGEP